MTVNPLDGKWSMNGKDYPVPSLFVLRKDYEKYFPSLCAEKAAASVCVCDSEAFTLEKKFCVSKSELEEVYAILHFDRLDTLCNVYVNSNHVAFCKNCHRSYDFPVKEYLNEGLNTISVSFLSLRKYIAGKQSVTPLPYNAMGIKNHPHVRKPASHFGWDFAPPLCAQGITGKTELRFYSHSVIKNFDVRQRIEGGKGIVEVSATLSKKSSVNFSLTYPDGTTRKQSADENGKAVFTVENPELWFCSKMGKQPLYTASASVVAEDGTSLDRKEKRVGFRSICLDRKKDRFGKNFQFFINGEPIFAKGANFVPIHMIYTGVTHDELYALLYKCKEANMNMVRVWGGGFYESDDFYDICDELGLLVWQDCAFACCAYPFMDTSFMAEVTSEIRENVLRLRHHPSLCLWCGNNEIESISLAWANRRSFIRSTGEFFYKTLPELINRYDGETPYHECSPGSGEYMKDPSGDSSGDSHIWNTWHGFRLKDYYSKRFSRFCSEVGMESYPCSPVTANQYCALGDERLDFYLTRHFTLGKNEQERRYLTQLLQLEYMKEGAEHFRRNGERCHGFLFWQLNDCWQSCSWSGVDVKGQKKALMFAAKSFFENIHVSCAEAKGEANVFVTNETRSKVSGRLQLFFESTDSRRSGFAERRVSIGAFSSDCVMKIALGTSEKKSSVLVMRLFDESGALLSENRRIFCENNELALLDPVLSLETHLKAGRVYVTVTAEKYARYVELSCSAQGGDFSDNYFDLCAGESKTVELYNPCAGLSDFLSVRSLYDVLKNRNAKKDRARHAAVALKPEVIANTVARIIGD